MAQETYMDRDRAERMLVKYIERAFRSRYFGSVKIQFQEGRPVHIEATQTYRPDTLPES